MIRATLLQRCLPRPLSSALLVLTWLILTNSVTAGQVILAAALALTLPLLLQQLMHRQLLRRSLWTPSRRIHRPLLLLRFSLTVLMDIAIANLEVAALIVRPNRGLRPAFVEMPLAMRDETAIALLMSVITLTPGTLAARLSDDHSSLLIHALHTDDPAALVAHLQRRYEQPLREIFRC
jgi:multicomponent K+:H+ antiporter subunit E